MSGCYPGDFFHILRVCGLLFKKVPKLQYLCQLKIRSTLDILSKQNELKSVLISKQQKEISDLKNENSTLKKACASKDAAIRIHKKQKKVVSI